MQFQWDDTKNIANFKKHSVWFEEAQTVWTDKNSIEFFDPDHSHSEDRFIRVGFSLKDNLLMVVFCERKNGVIRIISARKGTTKERSQYEEGI
jgi:uncharacterized DUF497 family protein